MQWTVAPGTMPGPIRRAIRSYLADDCGVDTRLDDIELVAGELLANVTRHAPAGGSVQVYVAEGTVHVRVADDGPAPPTRRWADESARPPRPDTTGGRGLWIARQVADELRVEQLPHGTVVEAAIACRPSRRPRDAD